MLILVTQTFNHLSKEHQARKELQGRLELPEGLEGLEDLEDQVFLKFDQINEIPAKNREPINFSKIGAPGATGPPGFPGGPGGIGPVGATGFPGGPGSPGLWISFKQKIDIESF